MERAKAEPLPGQAEFKTAHADISTVLTTDQHEVDQDRQEGDIQIAFTYRFNKTRHVETQFGKTRVPVDRRAFEKVQGEPRITDVQTPAAETTKGRTEAQHES